MRTVRLLWVLAFVVGATLIAGFRMAKDKTPDGAWQIERFEMNDVDAPDDATGILIFAGSYYYWALYDEEMSKFYGAAGGTYRKGGNTLEYEILFHTMRPDLVGQRLVIEKRGGNDKWRLTSPQGLVVEMKRIKEDVESPLMGAWRISQRQREGQMMEITDGPRKTIKMLSNQRFQWAAFNSETKEFFGTGGGTYSIEDGKYTESISFFSRDSTRVGMSLAFDYEVSGEDWLHSGNSSKGQPIQEVWSKLK